MTEKGQGGQKGVSKISLVLHLNLRRIPSCRPARNVYPPWLGGVGAAGRSGGGPPGPPPPPSQSHICLGVLDQTS